MDMKRPRESCHFVEHLSEIFQSYNNKTDNNLEREINEFLQNPFQMSPPIHSIFSMEINYHKKLVINKSPGWIWPNYSEHGKLPRKVIILLTHLYNAILRTTLPDAMEKIIINNLEKPFA